MPIPFSAHSPTGFATLQQTTMASSADYSVYSREAPNEDDKVHNENLDDSTNGDNGVDSKFQDEAVLISIVIALTYCCLSIIYLESDKEKLLEMDDSTSLHPLQITMNLQALCGWRSPTGPIPKATQCQLKVAV